MSIITRNKKGIILFYNFIASSSWSIKGYKFEYFTKSNSAKKNHILQLFPGDQSLLSYLPDDIKPISINRELLLSVSNIIIFRYFTMRIGTSIFSSIIYIKESIMKEAMGN